MTQLVDNIQTYPLNKLLFRDASAILSTRSLEKNHERLSELLYPGMSVLDIGCGSGSITRGIAEKVIPNGQVIGIDISDNLILEAYNNYKNVSNLSFKVGDIYSLPFDRQFDLVFAGRIFHWLKSPHDALEKMIEYVKPGGRIIVHEPNIEQLVWQPNPPNSFKLFYNAFLEWRSQLQLDNTIGDKLSQMFANAELINIVETPQPEITNSSDPDFKIRVKIWEDIMAIHGSQLIQYGLVSDQQMLQARKDFQKWLANSATYQSVSFIAVDAIVPT